MSEITLILVNISRVIFLASNIFLDYSFLTPKRPVRFQIIAFVGAGMAQYFLRTLLAPTGIDPFLLGYTLGLLYLMPVMLIFKETTYAKLFVFFMVTSLTQLNFLICLFIEILVFNHMVGDLILAGQLLELASLPLIKKYVQPHIKNILDIINQQNPIFILLPFLSFVLLAFYGVARIYILSNFIPLILCTLLIIFSYYLIALSIKQTKRHAYLEKQLHMQRDHYHNLNNSITATKIQRHDLRHHLVTTLEFLGNNNAAAAQEYLESLSISYDDSSLPSVCRNQSADALICYYIKLAKQQGITVNTKLNIPDDLAIDDLDLCVIIGNCLENAIEACCKLKNTESRFINISAKIAKGHLILTFANSFNGLVQHQDQQFFSTKKETGHGIGLTSIKTFTNKYHGHCSTSFDDELFKVSVSLKLS